MRIADNLNVYFMPEVPRRTVQGARRAPTWPGAVL